MNFSYWSIIFFFNWSFLNHNTVFLHDVYEMEVSILIFISFCNNSASVDVWFSDLWNRYISRPIENFVVKVIHSTIWGSICHANVSSLWMEHTMNLTQHRGRVWCRIITWQDWIKASLIKYTVEYSIFKLKLSCIHLFKN